MKRYAILFSTIFLIAIFGGCSTSSQLTSNMVDSYYGFLPCADCPGISYILKLDKHGKFKLTRDYHDRNTTNSTEGKYTLKDGRLYLYNEGKIIERYLQDGKKLIFLDADGHRINSLLAPHYILYKGDPTKANMPKKFDKPFSSLMYKGTGNEPFWMVQVTDTNTILFTGLVNGEQKFDVPITSTLVAEDNQSVIYTGEDYSHKIEVRIIHGTCQDNMSGQYSNTTLEVEYTIEGQKQVLRGCGNYQNKYQLNGNWRLKQIDGQDFDSPDFATLTIYFPDNRIAGNSGCNQYFGSIQDITDDSIKFNQVGTSKRACPDMSLEHKFLKLLNQDNLKWEIDNQSGLHLQSNTQNFVFSRTKNGS